MRPRYLKAIKKYIEKSKDGRIGIGIGCAVSIHPGVTQKPDNTPKGIRNPIPRDLYNLLKVIWNLVTNRIRSQCPIGLTITT